MDAPKKKPAGQGGQFAKQGTLFEPPPFSPEWPSSATKEGQLLAALLDGATLNHPEFGSIARTWRLAAYAYTLKRKGWRWRTSPTGAAGAATSPGRRT